MISVFKNKCSIWHILIFLCILSLFGTWPVLYCRVNTLRKKVPSLPELKAVHQICEGNFVPPKNELMCKKENLNKIKWVGPIDNRHSNVC